MRELFKVLPKYPRIHDSTLGFPGEGWKAARQRRRNRCGSDNRWSKEIQNLTMVTWNTRSLTEERYDCCKRLGHDVLGVTELWRRQEKFTDFTNEFTVSVTNKDKDGNLINENDSAAGVGILLSERAQKKFMGADNDGSERACWVRLKGPVCNSFIVAVCVPHSSRVNPAT